MTDTRELIERLDFQDKEKRKLLRRGASGDQGLNYASVEQASITLIQQQAQEIESLKVLVERYKSALTSLAISPTPSMKPQYWKTIASEALQEESHD